MRTTYRTVLATVAAALLVASCGGGGDGDSANSDVTTLRLPSWWFGEPGNMDWLNAAVEAFEKENPEIKIDGYDLSSSDYTDQMLTEVSAGDPPDILHLTLSNIGSFQRIGALAPLDEYLADSDINEETYIPAQWKAPFTQEGSTTAIIQMVANYVPFYNADILAEHGYDEFPTTPKGFFDLVKDIADPPDLFGYAAMMRPGSASQTMLDLAQWVIANGGGWAEDGEITIDSPENVEALKNLKSLYESDSMPIDVDKSTYRQMWWEGKIGVLIDGSWMMGFAEDNNPEIIDSLQTAPVPWPDSPTATTYQAWAISEASENKDEAWRFIEFLQSREWQEKQITITRAISPRTDAMPDGFLEENPWFAAFDEAAHEDAVLLMPPVLLPHGAEVTRLITGAFESAVYDAVPMADALADAQAEIEAIVEG